MYQYETTLSFSFHNQLNHLLKLPMMVSFLAKPLYFVGYVAFLGFPGFRGCVEYINSMAISCHTTATMR